MPLMADSTANTSAQYAAVIVETRPFEGFGQIVRDHLKHLPSGWALEVYCSNDNKAFLEQELMGMEYNIHAGYTVANTMDYNKILMSTGFWSYLTQYERVLMFQTDSELLRPGIEEFLKYDYVGAPWTVNTRGGNGGLSIRNPKAMLKAIEEHSDHWFEIGLVWLIARLKLYRIMNKGKYKQQAS